MKVSEQGTAATSLLGETLLQLFFVEQKQLTLKRKNQKVHGASFNICHSFDAAESNAEHSSKIIRLLTETVSAGRMIFQWVASLLR